MTDDDRGREDLGALKGGGSGALTGDGLGSPAAPSTAGPKGPASARFASGDQLEAMVAGGPLGFVRALANLPTGRAPREEATDDLQAGAMLFLRRKADDYVQRRGEDAVVAFPVKPKPAQGPGATDLQRLGAAAASLRGEFGPEAVRLLDFAERLARYRETLDLVEYLAGKAAQSYVPGEGLPAAAAFAALAEVAAWGTGSDPATGPVADLFAERALANAGGAS